MISYGSFGLQINRSARTKFWCFTQADDTSLNWDSEIDLLFIDTSHQFRHTLAELEKFEPFVRKRLVIVIHDPILFPEVLKAARQYTLSRKDIAECLYLNSNGLIVIFKN
jgi:hypothetical protein